MFLAIFWQCQAHQMLTFSMDDQSFILFACSCSVIFFVVLVNTCYNAATIFVILYFYATFISCIN